MTTNFTQTGTDIDKILIKQQYASLVPVSKRKSNWGQWTGYGSLWGFGRDDYGQLGLSDTTHRSSPVQVGSLTNWKSISCGYLHTLATKTDGTLWSWGYNRSFSGGSGFLGLGDTTNYSSPTQVGTLTNWNIVACGFYHTMATKTDGTLWSWGGNSGGELGLGDFVHRSSPVQVGSLTNWSKVSCSKFQTLAIKTDGTLWAWGGNSYGQLGLSDRTSRSSPVQVGTLNSWSLVSCGWFYVVAIENDGTLWSWGYNNNGQLGQGNITRCSSPVQVGALTNWSLIAGGKYNISAIKTDGTLWSWGYNYHGQLGLGDVAHRSSPVQVGALTNWSLIAGGCYLHSIATKTDGTLWSWGYNISGQLGLGDITWRSSPVQVGSLTNWSSAAGDNHTIAKQYI